jgi:hypothetical protein
MRCTSCAHLTVLGAVGYHLAPRTTVELLASRELAARVTRRASHVQHGLELGSRAKVRVMMVPPKSGSLPSANHLPVRDYGIMVEGLGVRG